MIKSNQLECGRCGNRKIKFLDRKNANVCECGAMMSVYVKKAIYKVPPVEILMAQFEFADEGGDALGQLFSMAESEEGCCGEEHEEGEECCDD